MSGTGYAEIASHYRRLIADETLAPGDALPSMREVCDTFNVSITTANRAFRMLKTEGLTEPDPGNGTVVADRSSEVAATGAARLKRIARTSKPYALKEKSIRHTAALRSCADVKVAELLDVEPHDEIVLRTRVFARDDKPTVFAVSCINVRALGPMPELLNPEPFQRFWQETYTERTGRTVTRTPERRGARLASQHELDALGVDAPAGAAVPVLVLVTTFHDEDGPLEVWEDVYAPGLWQEADE